MPERWCIGIRYQGQEGHAVRLWPDLAETKDVYTRSLQFSQKDAVRKVEEIFCIGGGGFQECRQQGVHLDWPSETSEEGYCCAA